MSNDPAARPVPIHDPSRVHETPDLISITVLIKHITIVEIPQVFYDSSHWTWGISTDRYLYCCLRTGNSMCTVHMVDIVLIRRLTLAPPPKTVGRLIYHTILRRNLNILIPLWYFCRRPVFAIKLKIWLDQTCDPELQFWVLLVVANKNHGQPFVQYVERREPISMGAAYHLEELPLKKGSRETIMPLF